METKYLDVSHVGPPEEKVRELYSPLLPYFQDCKMVLDVGCGRGIVLQMLAARGIAAIGCDAEREMVAGVDGGCRVHRGRCA
jgi:2-polyprenyl-3-methyl-5-hydroxy-6-metoxy-1,4-benzoquinol methylase